MNLNNLMVKDLLRRRFFYWTFAISLLIINGILFVHIIRGGVSLAEFIGGGALFLIFSCLVGHCFAEIHNCTNTIWYKLMAAKGLTDEDY